MDDLIDNPDYYTDEEKKQIESVAGISPVPLSVHPDLKQTILFNWHNFAHHPGISDSAGSTTRRSAEDPHPGDFLKN